MSRRKSVNRSPDFRLVFPLDPGGVSEIWRGRNPNDPKLISALKALGSGFKRPVLQVRTDKGWIDWKLDPKVKDIGMRAGRSISEKLRSIRRR